MQIKIIVFQYLQAEITGSIGCRGRVKRIPRVCIHGLNRDSRFCDIIGIGYRATNGYELVCNGLDCVITAAATGQNDQAPDCAGPE